MSTAALLPPRAAPVVHLVPLGKIDASPSNPRKTFANIEELAEDVKVRGVLQPILVRPKGDRFEIVFGERRWRAVKAAKIETVPAFVREMGDEEVLEVQLVENSKRADIHPLEEADGYRQLHEKYKHSVEEIAAKVGKSRSAVYERIKLCALAEGPRKAFLEGKLSASTALLVARIPDKELQTKAVKDLAGSEHHDPMSYRVAVDHVQHKYMLQLADAPFDRADAKLLPKAGPCTTCAKRTGNQHELFADVKSPDVCTDPTCYGEKKDALWKLKVAKAKEAGQKVLPVSEAKEVFQLGGNLRYDAKFVDLDAKDYGHGGKTYRELLAKKEAPPPVLARDENGDVHELLPTNTFNKLTGRKERSSSTWDPKKQAEKQKEHEREEKEREKVEHAVVGKLVAAAEKGATTAAFWRLLVRLIARESYAIGGTLRRRGLSHAQLGKQVEKLHDRQLRGLALELVLEMAQDSVAGDGEPSETIEEACEVLGVDYTRVVNQILDPTIAQSCPGCHAVVGVKEGKFAKHEDKKGKTCSSSEKEIPPSPFKSDPPPKKAKAKKK